MQDPSRGRSRAYRAALQFEELATLVWPPEEIRDLDGWRLCFAGGCTKRANSVHCVSGAGGAQQRVERCEAIYRDYGQRVVFKLTDASFPQGLDDLLASRGYEFVEATSVQLRLAAATRTVNDELLARVQIEPGLPAGPADAWMRLGEVEADLQPAWRGIMQRIEGDTEGCAFASIEVDGELVATGVGVLAGGHACLCEIVTSPHWRRQGFSVAIVTALCRWADSRAARPWLQVVAANELALPLYYSLGFREMYQHWYRVSA